MLWPEEGQRMVLLPGASLNDHVEEEQMFPGGPTQETDQTVGSDLSPLCLYPPIFHPINIPPGK